jgi:hypothetical protein
VDEAVLIGVALGRFGERGIEFSISGARSGFGMLVMTQDWQALGLSPSDCRDQACDLRATLSRTGFNLRAVRYDFSADRSFDSLTVYGDDPADRTDPRPIFGRAVRRYRRGSSLAALYLDVRAVCSGGVRQLALEHVRTMGWSGATRNAFADAFDDYARLGWIQLLGIETSTGSIKIDIANPDPAVLALPDTAKPALQRLAGVAGYAGFRWRDGAPATLTLYGRARRVEDMEIALARLTAD